MKPEYSHITSSDGAKIVYDININPLDNPVLIFLHGFGGDLTAWDEERNELTSHNISSVAIDMRGHGLSSRSDNYDFYDFKNFSRDIVDIINTEKISKPVFVGHCFGGMISILTEHYYPKVAKGLVLIDTNYKPPYFAEKFIHLPLAYKLLHLLSVIAPDAGIEKHNHFQEFIGTSDLDIRRIFSDIEHTSLKTYLLIIEHLINYGATKYLKDIKKPTLIIEGLNDKVFPPEVARKLNKNIIKSKLVLIPKANHIIVINNPLISLELSCA